MFYTAFRHLRWLLLVGGMIGTVLPQPSAGQETTGRQIRYEIGGNDVDSMLQEISRMTGDSLKWSGYRVLLQHGELSARELRRMTGHAAGEIKNARILKDLLVEISGYDVDDRELTEALIAAANEIKVSPERTSVLIAIIKRRPFHPAAGSAIAGSLKSISPDREKLSLMLELVGWGPADEKTLSSYIEAIPSLHDSGDRRQAIYALMSRQPLSGQLWVQLLQQMRPLSSDNDKTVLLVEAAELFPGDNEVVSVYLEVANTIKDSAEKNRTLAALVSNHSFNDAGVLRLIDMSKKMSSDQEKASTLILVTRYSIHDEQVFYAYLNVVKTIDSSFEIERALRALLTSQELSYEVLQEAKRVTFRLQNQILRREMLQLIAKLEREAYQRF